ncbi:MAG: UDP-3-O-[3-hydroxymyristoyl] N-acetylglucosamine deacetylase [Phycisphaerales bacterium]|nr:UDP-3-O-[3-hydroxymyristoyl] N-acetylglucosamine deacetylase [Phycisphaerales bacterium]
MSQQRTIQKDAELSGRGLFTGYPVVVRFRPAGPGSGVTFIRTDQPTPVRIPARIDNLAKRARRTALRNGAVAVETVEHCLAAVRGMGLDNLDIELNNAELPAVDGSSGPYVEALAEAGVAEQSLPREVIPVCEPIHVSEGEAELMAWPGDATRLDVFYELDYSGTALGRQICSFSVDRDNFASDIAPARTFVLEEEARALQAAGLGTHLSPQDVLVIGADGPIDNTFRFPDECVRHKILDLVGDLMLSGGFVCGRVYARKSGHHLNHELVKRLLEARERAKFARKLTGPAKLDQRAIQRILPHRFPMLLVDRVVAMDDRRAIGVKNVTINEPFFVGHYPRQPIMPGVLIVEALAQLGGLLLSSKLEHTGKVALLLSLDRVKFRRPVSPGDQLILEAEAVNVRASVGQVFCRARVADEPAAEASIRFVLADSEPN